MLPSPSQAPTSLTTLELKANVCAVKWRPGSAREVAVGCADHFGEQRMAASGFIVLHLGFRLLCPTLGARPCCTPYHSPCLLLANCAYFATATYPAVYLYDLRSPAQPLYTLPGHAKAVSYVRFSSPSDLISASTDSTLRLWSLSDLDGARGSTAAVTAGAGNAACSNATGSGAGTGAPEVTAERIFEGHTNEKNFVGLAGAMRRRLIGREDSSMAYTSHVPRIPFPCS